MRLLGILLLVLLQKWGCVADFHSWECQFEWHDSCPVPARQDAVPRVPSAQKNRVHHGHITHHAEAVSLEGLSTALGFLVQACFTNCLSSGLFVPLITLEIRRVNGYYVIMQFFFRNLNKFITIFFA